MPSAIEIESLTKYYGTTVGVESLTLSAEEGEIFGFLGPNGAGKTTCIRLLMNFIKPESGSIRIFGEEVKWGDYRYRRDIGYLPGDLHLPRGLSGEWLLDYWADLNGGEAPLRGRSMEALALSRKDLQRKVREYSRGMRQKLGLVGALQCRPRLAVLDEPTEGLDPLVKHSLLELLEEIRREGSAIFFSSHILSEVEHIADTAAIIRKGRLAACSSIEELKHRRKKEVAITFRTEGSIDGFLRRYPCEAVRDNLKLRLLAGGRLEELITALEGVAIEDIEISEPSLEDIFLEYYYDASV